MSWELLVLVEGELNRCFERLDKGWGVESRTVVVGIGNVELDDDGGGHAGETGQRRHA